MQYYDIDYNKLTLRELEEIRDELTCLIVQKENAAAKERLKLNEGYIGRCYDTGGSYFKIMSVNASEEGKLITLNFPYTPSAVFFSNSDIYFPRHESSPYDADFIYLDEERISSLQLYKEISLETFNKSLDNFINQLKTFKL